MSTGLALSPPMAPSFPGEAGTHKSYRTIELEDCFMVCQYLDRLPSQGKTNQKTALPFGSHSKSVSINVQIYAAFPSSTVRWTHHFFEKASKLVSLLGDRSGWQQNCQDVAAESLLAQPRDLETHRFYTEWGTWQNVVQTFNTYIEKNKIGYRCPPIMKLLLGCKVKVSPFFF